MAIIEVKVPTPGESINEVELSAWLVEDGAVVRKNTEIAEIESDKATLTLVADEAGKISHKATEGDTLAVGSVACIIDTSVQPDEVVDEVVDTKENTSPKENEVPTKAIENTQKGYDKVKVSPLAEKLMVENNLSLDDVMNGLRRLKRSDITLSMSASSVDVGQGVKKVASREVNTERMSSLRRKLSERLVSVKNETAMLTTFNEVDMKPIMDMRKKYQKQFVEKHNVKVGFMSFFLKACAIALQEFPNVNAMIDDENIVSFKYADISVAVSTPKGLMVPVIRNVESLGLAEIEQEIINVAEKARKGKLSIPEMTGGTFTVTNGGIFGSMLSTPIINPPQSAILGMHNIIERPIAIDGKVVIRPMMYIALSYDHRVIDGRESVGFLVKVKQLLENPTKMLFGGKSGEEMLLEV